MEVLPVLKKNAYLIVLIKDNYIYANLAYTDFVAQKTYILKDTTDLSPLRFRLDDIVFNKSFWSEYFNSLEKEFDWDIVNRVWDDMFQIKNFEKEEVGVSCIKVVIDDNQPFFKNIYLSLKEFSKDIVLRVLDDKYMEALQSSLLERLGYDDILWLDLDLSHFSIFRTSKTETSSGLFSKEGVHGKKFSSSKIDWNNEIGLIDFVRSSKLQAFLSVDSSSEDISNRWANFVAHGYEYLSDSLLEDVLRAFTTLQILSIKQSNIEKFENIGKKNTAIFLTGKIPNIMKKREQLFSLIDGLELEGIYDLYIDEDSTLLTFGKSMAEKESSEDIVVLRSDILPQALKVLIPDVPVKSKNKVVFSGKILSQDFETKEIYALNPTLDVIKLPEDSNKTIVEGEFKNGAELSHYQSNNIQFMSSKGSIEYSHLVVDCRSRPIVYGPSIHENRVKLKVWGDGDKE